MCNISSTIISNRSLTNNPSDPTTYMLHVKLTTRGYGTLPYEYNSQRKIPKLHTSDLFENF